VAHEKYASELDKFSHPLNCAADWKCRWKAKQHHTEEPQGSSNSKGNGLGFHFPPDGVSAKQQETKGFASVVENSGGVVHQRAPTAEKRRSRIAGKESGENVTGAQARQGKQNEQRILA